MIIITIIINYYYIYIYISDLARVDRLDEVTKTSCQGPVTPKEAVNREPSLRLLGGQASWRDWILLTPCHLVPALFQMCIRLTYVLYSMRYPYVSIMTKIYHTLHIIRNDIRVHTYTSIGGSQKDCFHSHQQQSSDELYISAPEGFCTTAKVAVCASGLKICSLYQVLWVVFIFLFVVCPSVHWNFGSCTAARSYRTLLSSSCFPALPTRWLLPCVELEFFGGQVGEISCCVTWWADQIWWDNPKTCDNKTMCLAGQVWSPALRRQ